MAKGMEVSGPMPPHLRTYQIMQAFPGLSPEVIDETPAVTWDWLLAIHTETLRARRDLQPNS